MGMFDSVMFKCSCGTEIEAQTKSGYCLLKKYDSTKRPVPFEVAQGVNTWAPFRCSNCEKLWEFAEPEPDYVWLEVREVFE